MKNLISLKERYLRDPLPIRLGGIAANLARVKSFSKHLQHKKIVYNLLNESKFFIEWATKEADLETQVLLVEIQIQLARWQFNWNKIWNNEQKRNEIAIKAQDWSQQILKKAGLIAI